jgi:hypothetical protein
VSSKPQLVDRMWSWAATLPLATVLTLGGLYFFASQFQLYSSFYGPLSVDLEDVGLNYVTILAHSTNQIAMPVILTLLGIYTLRRAQQARTHGEWRAGRAYTGRWRRLRQSRAWLKPIGWLILGIVLTFALAVYVFDTYAVEGRIRSNVSAVRDGRAVAEIKGPVSRLSLLNVYVRAATIEPVAAANVSPAVRKLAGRQLLYIGQSDGTLVLFDPTVDRTIQLPRNSVVLSLDSSSPGNPGDYDV